MSFYLHTDFRDFFGAEGSKMFAKSGGRDEAASSFLMFDGFYACLLIGLQLGKVLPDQKKRESNNFIDHYPNDYDQSRDYIAGLIVETELRRLDTADYSSQDFEREIAKLLNLDNPTHLSQAGIEAANAYAAGGFEYLRTALQPRPTSAQNFLIRFHELWNIGLEGS